MGELKSILPPIPIKNPKIKTLTAQKKHFLGPLQETGKILFIIEPIQRFRYR